MSRFFMIIALCIAFAGQSLAQEAPAPAAATAAPVEAAKPKSAALDLEVNEAGNVTFDFRDADIKNVLKVLAYKSKVNIIAGPEVVGLVNIQLKNVPWQRALDVILSTYGYSYEQRGTIITVTTIANMKKRREDAKELADQQALATQTFVLNFSKAEDVVKSIDKMKSLRGSITFDQRTNSVIVTDVDNVLDSVEDVIARLDAVTPQILIEARIIETGLSNSEALGIQWPSSISGAATFPVRTHSAPWNARANQYMPAGAWVNPSIGADGAIAKTIDATSAYSMTYGTLSLSALSATLDMLQSRTNTNVLSNPKIVTLDNQPATIIVGNKYPLPKYTYSNTQDKVIISGWEYLDYGLTFKVTPHINGKGVITLDVEPEIVDSSSTVPFIFADGAEPTNIPVLTKESAKTNVMIRDGETLVIAGLIKDKKTKTTQKVPILGSIPLVGLLFQHKEDTIIKTEIVIFITPHIITIDSNQAAAEAPVK